MSTTDRSALEKMLKALEQQSDEEDFSQRTVYTYLIGVYLAVNALQDAFLLVEGPDCSYMKTQYIQGNHDWLSTLTSVSGYHRIANTALHPSMIAESREEPLAEQMGRMASHEATGALMVTSMPMATVTGADYERICRDVAEETGKEVIHVPGLSLSGDWLDGYGETLKSLARQLDLSGGNPRPENVAVVGYLYDRNEEDHRANIREMRAMCEAANLNLVSVWLSGQRCADLSAVRDASTLIALPYGRKAARHVARQTGAEIVNLPLPFGLEATELWMRTLGERSGAKQSVQSYMDREMYRIAPMIEWLIPYVFQSIQVGYVGDPHLLPGFRNIMELLGASVRFAVITNHASHVETPGKETETEEMICGPKMKRFIGFVSKHIAEHNIRLLVTNNHGVVFAPAGMAVVEFGFPSVYTHALYDRPFLGYRGFMAFVDTLANTFRQQELFQAGSSYFPKDE